MRNRRVMPFAGAAWEANRVTRDRHAIGAVLALAGASLIWRWTRRDTRARITRSGGTTIEETVAINRRPDELYAFWRTLRQLPTVMPQLTSVQVTDDRRSRWVFKGPAGWRTTWFAEIIDDIPDQLIAWRSTEGSDFVGAGSVHFECGGPARGTVVRVTLQYKTQAGKLGAAIARAFDAEPSQVVREGLRRFKRLMETGEIPTTEGQARGSG